MVPETGLIHFIQAPKSNLMKPARFNGQCKQSGHMFTVNIEMNVRCLCLWISFLLQNK